MTKKLFLLFLTAVLCTALGSACMGSITLTPITSVSLGSNANDVAVSGNYAYVATSTGLYIVNISNPAMISNSSITGSVALSGASDVAVQGNYAFVTCTNRMAIVDVTSKTLPHVEAIYSPGSTYTVQRVSVSGDYAYIQYRSTRTYIPPGGSPSTQYNYYYAIIDISSPASPQVIGSCKSAVSNTTASAFGLAVYGDMMYGFDTAVSLINVLNPASPQLTTGESLGKCGTDAFVNDLYLYNVNNEAGTLNPPSYLQIRDLSARLLGYIRIDGSATVKRLSISGKYAYVSRLNSGISVFDISDIANLTQATTHLTTGTAYGVFAAGDYVYIADGVSGLSVMRINGQTTSVDLTVDPASPGYLGSTITLTASNYPGKDAQYEFRAGTSVIQPYSSRAKCSWKPTTAGNYALTVAAKDYDGNVVVSPIITYKITSHVSYVSLTANPASPQPLDTPITLTATATGGEGLTYDFYDGSNLLSRLDDTSPTFTWTPSTEGLHRLKVYATDSGGTTVESAAINYTVGTPLTSVSLSASPVSPQLVGTQVTLTATAVGGSGVQYQFMSGTTVLREYSSVNTFTYTVSSAKNYQLSVIAKDSSGNTVTSQSLSFDAVTPVQSVSLAATPASPVVGTKVTLKATAVGGIGLQYKFIANGTYVLRDFASSNSMTWTFSTPGTRQLKVVAKDSTGNIVTSSEISLPVSSFSVGLAASPSSPQLVGTSVTLTATTVGGTGVTYKFMAGTYMLRDFALSNTFSYQFKTATTQKLTVIAKDAYGATVTSPVLNYTIVPTLQSASVSASPASPTAGTTVTFTAASVGGLGVQYKFIANGSFVMRDFASSNTTTWKFTTPGTRTITVVAKDNSGKIVTSQTINLIVSNFSVTLSASPTSPQPVGSDIVLTATAIGGTGVQYKFMAGSYVLRDFAVSNTLTYKFKNATTQKLSVIAKDSNGNTVTSPVLLYTIVSP